MKESSIKNIFAKNKVLKGISLTCVTQNSVHVSPLTVVDKYKKVISDYYLSKFGYCKGNHNVDYPSVRVYSHFLGRYLNSTEFVFNFKTKDIEILREDLLGTPMTFDVTRRNSKIGTAEYKPKKSGYTDVSFNVVASQDNRSFDYDGMKVYSHHLKRNLTEDEYFLDKDYGHVVLTREDLRGTHIEIEIPRASASMRNPGFLNYPFVYV